MTRLKHILVIALLASPMVVIDAHSAVGRGFSGGFRSYSTPRYSMPRYTPTPRVQPSTPLKPSATTKPRTSHESSSPVMPNYFLWYYLGTSTSGQKQYARIDCSKKENKAKCADKSRAKATKE